MKNTELNEAKEEAVVFLKDVVRMIPDAERQRAEDCMRFAAAFSNCDKSNGNNSGKPHEPTKKED